MRKRWVALALVASTAAGACGGGMSAGDYYTAAEAAATTYDRKTEVIFDGYRDSVAEALAGFEERTSAESDTAILVEETALLLERVAAEVTAAFQQVESALEAFVAELGELDPPSRVASAHDDLVGALQRSLDAIPDLVTAVNDADTLSDIGGTINGSAFGDAQPRVNAACRELERLASELGTPADLRCGDPDGGQPGG